ncbi:MAG TPA: indole-3-glycerol phosphate synthase TrpC [Solirubrobacteraceae bacterium]|jgi:indole-3-glycerol phosphate synthase|nr:indole-3-glycerol phosphate synthase TrpC [Solirubrobacteraceae bacterium]
MSLDELAGTATSAKATVLERILGETRAELEDRKRRAPLGQLQEQTAARTASQRIAARRGGRFRQALERPGIGVIAEFKRRSPSAGTLREPEPDVAGIVSAYERGGASALSVLTEGANFDGSLADIGAARAACGLPILRKDFIIDPYQLHEACLVGAEAVLLIVAALEHASLLSLHELALGLGLDVLVEVHDREELARAEQAGARLIGVNNRDLRDFSVDLGRTERLLADMPPGATVVSESGISTPEQLRQLERQGVAAVLVGESLMRAPDPERALRALLVGSDAGAH